MEFDWYFVHSLSKFLHEKMIKVSKRKFVDFNVLPVTSNAFFLAKIS